MFAVHVEIGNGNGGVAGYFALQRDTGLLHARSDKVGSKGGDSVSDALSESCGQRTCSGHDRAGDQGIGISRENLLVIIMRIVKEDAGICDSVLRGHNRVVDLGDAYIEQSI